MAQRGRSRFPRRNERGRLTDWGVGPSGELVAVDSSAIRVFPTATAPNDKLTIVRTHLSLSFISTVEPSVANHMLYGFGLCIVSEDAAGVGATAIPGPLTDDIWDGWFVHRQGLVSPGVQGDGNGIISMDIQIDSKAMRIFSPGNNMVGVLETVETGVFSMTANLLSRQLFKLG